MEVHHGQFCTPIVFGDAVLSVVSYRDQRSHFGCCLVCALPATFLELILFCRFCMLFFFFFFCGAAPNVPPFIGSDVRKALLFYGMTLLFRGLYWYTCTCRRIHNGSGGGGGPGDTCVARQRTFLVYHCFFL